jgi:hypothetical protein
MHSSITLQRVADAAQRSMFDLDNPGFCIECGDETDGVEPDARGYKCRNCGAMKVYGAEELLHMVA